MSSSPPPDQPVRSPGTVAQPAPDGIHRTNPTLSRLRRESTINHELFEKADTNKDGVLSAHEQRTFRELADEGEHLPNDPAPRDGDPGPLPWHEFRPGDLPPARYHRWRKVAGRALSKAWGDSLFGLSSQAAFWSAMSTAPILLALLGFVGIIAPLFGQDTLDVVKDQLSKVLHGVFNAEVADNLVGDTVNVILSQPRGELISIGLVISLWAGSSSMSAFVEAITVAYRQHEYRNPVVERFFALGLYLVALVFGVLLLPLLAIGPEYLVRIFPLAWRDEVSTIISVSYYPGLTLMLILLIATLYKVAPKLKHPWRRGLPGAFLAAAVFLVASFGLRLYLSYVYSHGLTYGALATPITFLLFYYLASLSIILGAQFNNALLEYFPVKPKVQLKLWAEHAKVDTAAAATLAKAKAKAAAAAAAKEASAAPAPK